MSRAKRWHGPAAVTIGILWALLAWWSERPPGPRPASAPAQVFSAERAVDYLRNIAVRPHMTGSAEHTRVRGYLVDELRSLGFETEVHETTVLSTRGRLLRAATVRNIVARKRGTSSTGGVALATHYDSQQLPAGAGDDGAGVAATLEAVRALGADEPLRNDLYVIITDAEELGLLGAQGFVAEHRWWPEITVLLSFEARGAAGQSVMFETNEDNGWVVREFARADPHPTGSSLYYEVYRRLPNDTDFSVYKQNGVTGLNFALAERADVYHRPTDTIENLSLASLQHHGDHALGLTRHFGNLDLAGETTAPNVVFFRVPGLGLVSYPFAWVGALSLLAVAFAVVVVERAFGRQRVGIGGVACGLAVALVGIGLSAAAAGILWNTVSSAHHELGSIVGRALYNETWYMLALASLVVAVVAAVYGVARRWFGQAALLTGALLLPLALALLAWWFAPGVSMLLLWPLVFAVGALRYRLSRAEGEPADGSDLTVVAVLSAPVVLLLFPLVWTLFIGLNISAASLLGGCIALMLVLMLPLVEIAGAAGRVGLPLAALALAVALALIGVFDARPRPARPIPSDLVYALDRESGDAVWATLQPEDDGWIERFVGAGADDGTLASFLAGNQRPYRLAAAAAVDAPRAAVRVVSDVTIGGARQVRVAIESAIAPELMNVSPAPGSNVLITAVNDARMPQFLDAAAASDWLLQHFGRPPDGVLTLDLQSPADGPAPRLVLVEFLMRLPPVPGIDTERPPGWVAHGGRLTDASLFRQVIEVDGLIAAAR